MSNSKYCRNFWLKASVLLIITLTLSIIFIPVTFADTPFTITSGSTGYYNIVLEGNATEVEETAAEELQYWIEEATGVTLPIVAESGAQDKSFHIGSTAFAVANGIVTDEEEEWIIKNVGNKIVINGYGTKGTLYGVFHLLEDEIGIRWFNPWENYVPDLSSSLTIQNPINRTGKPAFKYRDFYDKNYETGPNFTGEQPYSLFYVRNRLNGHFSFTPPEYGGTISYGLPYHSHTFSHYFPEQEYYDDHPEYFALVDGVRDRGGQLCLTNSNVISIMKQKVKDSIADSYGHADLIGAPRPKFFSLIPNDARGLCECTACAWQRNAYGNSGYLLWFVNTIAGDVENTYPEVLIETLAYSLYENLPTGGVVPRDNLQIRLAHTSRDILHNALHANNISLRSKAAGWDNITDSLIWWDYGINYFPNPPTASMFNTKTDLLYMQQNRNLYGVFCEIEDRMTTDMHTMKTWMYAKLLEDPSLNESTLMGDFLDKYYGNAASYVEDYLIETREGSEATGNILLYGTDPSVYDYFDLDYVNWADENFDNAEAAVSSDSEKLRRLNECRVSLDRLILFRWDELKAESISTSTPMQFTKKESAMRYVETQKAIKDMRSLREPGDPNQTFNEKTCDEEMVKMVMPEELGNIPYRSMIDIPTEEFRLYTNNGGLEQIDDDDSIIGRCTKVTLDDFSSQTYANLHKPNIDIGVYGPTNGIRHLDSLTLSDITADEYKLYKVGNAEIFADDYIYLFRSWYVQADLDEALGGQPSQVYDIYVSMKFEGDVYGGSPSDEDAVYIERIILVDKGEVPDDLSSVDTEDITNFTPEEFRLYTSYEGIYMREDGEALTERCVKVQLEKFATETSHDYHLPPVPMGLYNPTDGTRHLRYINISQMTLNEYDVYKVENVQIKPDDYLYLFNSWYIQMDLEEARTSDPNQLYDIYVSMKFEGPVYGGDVSVENTACVDRVIVVRK